MPQKNNFHEQVVTYATHTASHARSLSAFRPTHMHSSSNSKQSPARCLSHNNNTQQKLSANSQTKQLTRIGFAAIQCAVAILVWKQILCCAFGLNTTLWRLHYSVYTIRISSTRTFWFCRYIVGRWIFYSAREKWFLIFTRCGGGSIRITFSIEIGFDFPCVCIFLNRFLLIELVYFSIVYLRFVAVLFKKKYTKNEQWKCI